MYDCTIGNLNDTKISFQHEWKTNEDYMTTYNIS